MNDTIEILGIFAMIGPPQRHCSTEIVQTSAMLRACRCRLEFCWKLLFMQERGYLNGGCVKKAWTSECI